MAKFPQWEDYYAQGDSLEEVINEIFYFVSSLIDLYREEGLKISLKLKSVKEQKTPSIKLKLIR